MEDRYLEIVNNIKDFIDHKNCTREGIDLPRYPWLIEQVVFIDEYLKTKPPPGESLRKPVS